MAALIRPCLTRSAFQPRPKALMANNIVGYYQDSSFNNYGFLYNGSTYTTLADPLGTKTYAYGISGNNIVGLYMDSSLIITGFLYNIGAGTYTTLLTRSASMEPLPKAFPATISWEPISTALEWHMAFSTMAALIRPWMTRSVSREPRSWVLT